ncbi:Hint domain-containing protein [Tritonibacter horizontis]|uniref:Hedgehog/Intein (Hint) domain-containing protein n=1 Tax=Tritonibacter horizontis TaxID=1768241 RepID=A0A132BV87_9RHOB|nr:Hint domain-containing protein [Tritonibacter horizontis]KUP92214.1 hypothetical protein TRIHO_28520 [Tritonibacter horizontis]
MLLDHTTAFTDYQPVDLLLDLRSDSAQTSTASRARPQQGGVLPGTLIETPQGFKQARALRPGDQVQTFDGGLREVFNIRHCVPRLTAMVHVPAGALGNDAALDLPSDAVVALEGGIALDLFDLPVVSVKLVALVGYHGITTALPQRLARIYIECEEEELLWAEGGLLLKASETGADDFYDVLSLTDTRQIVAAARQDQIEKDADLGTDLAPTGEGDEDIFDFSLCPAPKFDPLDLLFGRYAA